MRYRIAAIAAVVAIAGTLSACDDGDNVSTQPQKTPAAEQTETRTKEPAASRSPNATPGKSAAAVGDTISLHGIDDGSRLDVTILKWADPVEATDSFLGPEAGKRWIAGQFQITNTGKATYTDSPSNGAQVVDGKGQHFAATISGGITNGPEMTAALKLPPGDKVLGWIVFEVPEATSKISKVQFAMDSGFADETGQWTVK